MDDFELLIHECIKESFQSELRSLENKRRILSEKTIDLKTKVYEKLIVSKCVKEINNLKQFGNITLDKGEIKLVDIKGDQNDFQNEINDFNNCFSNNSLDVNTLTVNFSDEVEENTTMFYNNLSKCNSDDKEEAKDCIIDAIKFSSKNMMNILSKYTKKIDEKANMLI